MVDSSVPGAFRASLAGALDAVVAAVPRLLGFLIVLGVGWLVGSLLGRGVAAALQAIGFNDLAERSGLAAFLRQLGARADPHRVVTAVAVWFVRLVALIVAFDLLGLPAVSGVLQRLLLWLPNLVVALVVLVIGGLAAGAAGRLLRGVAERAGFTDPDLLGSVGRVAVWVFAIVIAVGQLGIAPTIVNALVVGTIGAVALATGLAFGLGGRDRAARLLDRWSETSARPRPAVGSTAPSREGRPRRSGFDRRRMTREGPDRRDSEGLVQG